MNFNDTKCNIVIHGFKKWDGFNVNAAPAVSAVVDLERQLL